MILHQIKVGTNVIPRFGVILTGKSISFIIFMIQSNLQSHFQGQIYNKNMILTNKVRETCNTSFSWDFNWKIYL